MAVEKKKSDEEFEILDLTDKNFLQKVVADLSKAGAAKQIAVGGASGWCAGYLSGNVGKSAAAALGGSLLILQIAHYKGYITINWGKLERTTKKKIRKLEKDAESSFPRVFNAISDFCADNMFLAGSFAGGFLLGLAS